jgi:hypothetical protein
MNVEHINIKVVFSLEQWIRYPRPGISLGITIMSNENTALVGFSRMLPLYLSSSGHDSMPEFKVGQGKIIAKFTTDRLGSSHGSDEALAALDPPVDLSFLGRRQRHNQRHLPTCAFTRPNLSLGCSHACRRHRQRCRVPCRHCVGAAAHYAHVTASLGVDQHCSRLLFFVSLPSFATQFSGL